MLLGKRPLPVAILLIAAIFFIYHIIITPDNESHRSKLFNPARSFSVLQSTSRPSSSSSFSAHLTSSETTVKHAYPAIPAIPAASRAASSPPPAAAKHKRPPYRVSEIRVDDVALLLYTDASAIWDLLPIHLMAGSLPARVNPSNILLYSNGAATFEEWRIVDVFENVTTTTTATSSSLKKQAPLLRSESRADDKRINKFFPLLQHAGRNKPHAKWYIYMEDDSYLFLQNLLHHLSTLNWEESWYIGRQSFKHGGHGGFFALSRGAWEQSFGGVEERNLQATFERYSIINSNVHGEDVLGQFLAERGVMFGEDAYKDETPYSAEADAELYWASSALSRENWCVPVYSWYHTDARDILELYALEGSWDFNKYTLLHRDIYTPLVARYVAHGRVDWLRSEIDNNHGHVADYEITPDTSASSSRFPTDVESTATWLQGWESADACEAACTAWPACVQWIYGADQRCRLDQEINTLFQLVRIPRRISEGEERQKMSSGWMSKRIDEWEC